MNQPASAYFLEDRHDPNETHTLSVLVANEPGVLARVIGLFSGRGYNIESLTVSETENQKHVSRITIVTTGTPMVIQQIKHQLDRMIPVFRVVDMTLTGRSIERELAMVKVRGGGDNRVELLEQRDLRGLVLHDRLDDDLAVGDGVQVGDHADPAEHLLDGLDLALRGGSLQRLLQPAERGLGRLLGRLDDHHVLAGPRAHLGDAGPHQAATDHTDVLHDPPSGRLLRRFHQCRFGAGAAGSYRGVRRASRRSRQAATVASTSRGMVISGGPGCSE